MKTMIWVALSAVLLGGCTDPEKRAQAFEECMEQAKGLPQTEGGFKLFDSSEDVVRECNRYARSVS